MEFNQSQTYANLRSAMERELMVSTLYRIYGDQARENGFNEIGNIFDTIARNELEHGRIFLRQINNGTIPYTEENLRNSAALEVATGELYRQYAVVATEEGYTDIAALFNGISNIEFNHDLAFTTQYEDVIRDQVFCKPGETLWICMACGNILSGQCAPEICPICSLPQSYYRVYTGEEDI